MRFLPLTAACLLLLLSMASTASFAADTAAHAKVYLEELTSPELKTLITKGHTTVLLPVGGTEQNGPHMVLGKHNVRARALAGQIAQRLGYTIVAPVLPYVPEGSIRPPSAHMRYTGTISISDAAFEAVLEGAARSFKQHGFRDVVFVGDHGGYQKNMARVAERLNREWAKDTGTRVHALPEYYAAATTPFNQSLRDKGYRTSEIGIHAGLADTAMAMAVDKTLVHTDQFAQAHLQTPANGVTGDPRRATAELGEPGIQHIVNTSVSVIRDAIRSRPIP